MISIIIPSHGDKKYVINQINTLKNLNAEIIIVESKEKYAKIAKLGKNINFLFTKKGRAHQLNHGAQKAKSEWLLFLHADAKLDPYAINAIENLPKEIGGGCLTQKNLKVWKNKQIAREYVKKHYKFTASWSLSAIIQIFSLISTLMDKWIWYRSVYKNTVYGDQAIFVRKSIFKKLKGYKNMPIFEDLDFWRRMKEITQTRILKERVYTYPRKQLEVGLGSYAYLCTVATQKYEKKEDPKEIYTWFTKKYTQLTYSKK